MTNNIYVSITYYYDLSLFLLLLLSTILPLIIISIYVLGLMILRLLILFIERWGLARHRLSLINQIGIHPSSTPWPNWLPKSHLHRDAILLAWDRRVSTSTTCGRHGKWLGSRFLCTILGRVGKSLV